MGSFMKQVQQAQSLVQSKAGEVSKKLRETEFYGYDDEEMVQVTMTGQQEPKKVEITQAAYDLGPEKLQEKINAALKEAHQLSQEGAKAAMRDMAKEMGLPPELMQGGLGQKPGGE